MEADNNSGFIKHKFYLKTTFIICIVSVFASLITGYGVYFWQQGLLLNTREKFRLERKQLSDKIEKLQQKLSSVPLRESTDFQASSQTEQKEGSPGYTKASHNGHYYNPMAFAYQYPEHWHVWYTTELEEGGGPDDIVNKISLHPEPYEISEFGKPAITGYSFRFKHSPQEIINPENLGCPVPAGEPGEYPGEDKDDFSCIKDYKPQKLDYKIFDPNGYCYQYKIYEAHSGWNKEYSICVATLKSKTAFVFSLNDSRYSEEFKHFIESLNRQI